MTVSLSIKNVPAETVDRLRRQASAHHRSLQGELMAIIDAATRMTDGKKSIAQILAEARGSGFSSAATSAQYIREDRDAADR